MPGRPRTLLLVLEFGALFLAIPLAIRLLPRAVAPFPLLWAAALYCRWQLRRDPAFPRASLWNARAGRVQLRPILLSFAVLGGLIAFGTARLRPDLLFNLIRSRPVLWALVMVLYPIVSVYPQGLIYRAFVLHRYRPFVASALRERTRTRALILLSAAVFGFMHIIFRNPLAPALTFAGGLMFAWRYTRSHSLAVSTLEHSLYGCLLFTIGLGQFFYPGTIRLH